MLSGPPPSSGPAVLDEPAKPPPQYQHMTQPSRRLLKSTPSSSPQATPLPSKGGFRAGMSALSSSGSLVLNDRNTFVTAVDFDEPTDTSKYSPGLSPAAGRKRVAKLEDLKFDFRDEELTPFPPSVPLPAILESVVNSIKFQSAAMKQQWKQLFASPLSQAVMQDAFWIVCCQHLDIADLDSDTKADKALGRLASSYSKLLMSVPQHFKDKFFRRYYDGLAQVIFAALWLGFVASRKQLTEDFKEVLINQCAEWTQGWRPYRISNEHWNVSDGQPTSKSRGRSRGGAGVNTAPTVFEDRMIMESKYLASVNNSVNHPPGSTPRSAGPRSRGFLLSTKSSSTVLEPESAPLQDAVTRERTCYELSHSGLVREYLKRTKRPVSTGSLRPEEESPISSLATRVTLTQEAGRPLSTMAPSKHTRATHRAPTLTGAFIAAGATTFSQLVDKAEANRAELKLAYVRGIKDAKREIRLARTLAESEQSALQARQSAALQGDVHEFSNYLVSMWALAEERGRTQRPGVPSAAVVTKPSLPATAGPPPGTQAGSGAAPGSRSGLNLSNLPMNASAPPTDRPQSADDS